MVDLETVQYMTRNEADMSFKMRARTVFEYVDPTDDMVILVDGFKKYYQDNLEQLTSKDYVERHSQFHELISLFFYHLYRKFVREATRSLLETRENKDAK